MRADLDQEQIRHCKNNCIDQHGCDRPENTDVPQCIRQCRDIAFGSGMFEIYF